VCTRAPPNKILRSFLHAKGVMDEDIIETYTPFGHSDYQTIVADIKKFSAGGKTARVSTINGDSNVPFYKELGNAGLKANDAPVVAFSVGEQELRGVDAARRSRRGMELFHVDQEPDQHRLHQGVQRLSQGQEPGRRQGQAAGQRPDGSHQHRLHMWAQAVKKAGSTDDTDKVIAAMAGQTFPGPNGITSVMYPKNAIFGRLTDQEKLRIGLAYKSGTTPIPPELFNRSRC
jgi:urea transport system substrate-binding protein